MKRTNRWRVSPRTWFVLVAAVATVGFFPTASASAANTTCQGQEATILGTNGDDAGPNALIGTSGPDVIIGFAGNDTIRGLGGDDIICAGAGDDYIDAGSGDDTVRAQGGNDIVLGRAGNNDLNGGSGQDTVSYKLVSGAVTATLRNPASGQYVGQGGSDTLTQFESIEGSPFDDALEGSGQANQLDGGDGNDSIRGLHGDDIINGGGGDDVLFGHGGDDALYGGDGVDRAIGGPGIDQCPLAETAVACETTFVEVPLAIADYHFRDVGVADLDADGLFDLYTLNHFSEQSVLKGDGTGAFTDVVDAKDLHQDPSFPGLEDVETQPTITQPGVHVYFADRTLFIESVAGATPVNGDITILNSVTVLQDTAGFITGQSSTTLASGLEENVISVSISGNGTMQLDVYGVGAPIEFSLTPPVNLATFYVGADAVNPSSRDFDLYLRDRHASAWSDLNGDGILDAAIVRGGLHRQIDAYPLTMRDELLASTGGVYVDEADLRALDKAACSGTAVEWVDADSDGLLDLSIVCQVPEISQLHLQNSDGTFTEAGVSVGLGFNTQGPILWSDLDSDSDMDVVVPESDGIALYRNSGGIFTRELLLSEAIPPPTFGPVWSGVTAIDFDVDGDLDIFVSDFEGHRLLRNDPTGFQLQSLSALGLPDAGMFANWVDYDNDGLVDFYNHAEGLYRQVSAGNFEVTALAPPATSSGDVFTMASWFDMDNDGDRDLLGHGRWNNEADSTTRLFSTTGVGNHWLELVLEGSAGNREAIGAQVEIVTVAGTHLQEVGASEGALFSQGHFRLYYGLGTSTSALTVNVTWPDGSTQSVPGVAVDQILTITQP